MCSIFEQSCCEAANVLAAWISPRSYEAQRVSAWYADASEGTLDIPRAPQVSQFALTCLEVQTQQLLSTRQLLETKSKVSIK